MAKKHLTNSNFNSKNKKNSNKKLKKYFNDDNRMNFKSMELKKILSFSISEELYLFLKKKSKQENISISAILSKLVMVFASTEGIDIEVGKVRKLKQKKPD